MAFQRVPVAVQSVVADTGLNETLDDQHSVISRIQIRFNDVVSVLPGSFDLTRLGAGGGAVDLRVTNDTSSGVSWINLTFAPSDAQTYARGSGYSLVDGSYTLCLHGASLLDRAGSPTADRTDHFFRFFGDADDDRYVSGVDLTLFRRVTTADVRYAALRFAFDYDGDGEVGASDYRQFCLRYGRRQ